MFSFIVLTYRRRNQSQWRRQLAWGGASRSRDSGVSDHSGVEDRIVSPQICMLKCNRNVFGDRDLRRYLKLSEIIKVGP